MTIHAIIFYAAAIWITLLLGICIIQVVRASNVMSRLLALDTLTLVMIALLGIFAFLLESAYYLDAALILALLSFSGTLAAARFYSERKDFFS